MYNINYLIVLIDRVPRRLYSQHCSYRWHNNKSAEKKIKMEQ